MFRQTKSTEQAILNGLLYVVMSEYDAVLTYLKPKRKRSKTDKSSFVTFSRIEFPGGYCFEANVDNASDVLMCIVRSLGCIITFRDVRKDNTPHVVVSVTTRCGVVHKADELALLGKQFEMVIRTIKFKGPVQVIDWPMYQSQILALHP